MRLAPTLALTFSIAAAFAGCSAGDSGPGGSGNEPQIASMPEPLGAELSGDTAPELVADEPGAVTSTATRPLPCRIIYQWCTADCPPLPFFCALDQCQAQIEAHDQCVAACKEERSQCCAAYGTVC